MPRLKKSNQWFQDVVAITGLPSSSDWLKRSLAEVIEKNLNPEQAAADAETLARILRARAVAAKHNAQAMEANGKSSKLAS